MVQDKPILELNCGESGTLLHFAIMGAIATQQGLVRITGEGTLPDRGIDQGCLDVLIQQGVVFATNDGKLPILLLCGAYHIQPVEYRKRLQQGLEAINKQYSEELVQAFDSLYAEYKKDPAPWHNVMDVKIT